MMTINEVIALMENEKACIIKADTCDRDCAKCELLRNTEDLLSAYDLVIKTLKQEPILDKIRAEVIARYPKNYAGEPELGGRACKFSLNQILRIIDKYKAESENNERILKYVDQDTMMSAT